MTGAILLLLLGVSVVIIKGWLGDHEHSGIPVNHPVPAQVLTDRTEARKSAAAGVGIESARQILFGDFHVHTTVSMDAFLFSLPLAEGEGSHPLADACDFARFCSGIDFWSINDHAENLTPRFWNETKEALRQCNDVADPASPDTVAFLGFEWTQADMDDAKRHFGHRNVIYLHTGEEQVPHRPIGFKAGGLEDYDVYKVPASRKLLLPLVDISGFKRYMELNKFLGEIDSVAPCPTEIHTNSLPQDCMEAAEDPEELFAKLNQSGYESIAIPHGTAWGNYTPPASDWLDQLKGRMHDPHRQTLFEIYSGHGSAEEYRAWHAVAFDSEGKIVCPEPVGNYIPMCWRAGEIIEERCLAEGSHRTDCGKRAETARNNFLNAPNFIMALGTVPGVEIKDWLNAGQCPDCFLPSFKHRPYGSAQYLLAISNFDNPHAPKRFRFGFIGSSDNHFARPGNGYKEFARRGMTESVGVKNETINRLRFGKSEPPVAASRPYGQSPYSDTQLSTWQGERLMSFTYTGGLVAVHAEEKNRDEIWKALKRKEVYATSGDRILLWFDLINPPAKGAVVPMGGEVEMASMPKFRVRAVGAFKQKPGCPDYTLKALSQEEIQRLCKGDCYHPSNERKSITRIEVVKIRPQIRPQEPVGELIEDTWQTFTCPADPNGCVVEFTDPSFTFAGRDAVYYVRAIQEPSDTINGGNLRCTYDTSGKCIEVDPCYGDPRKTDRNDDCLNPVEERAWSSPIFVDYRRK